MKHLIIFNIIIIFCLLCFHCTGDKNPLSSDIDNNFAIYLIEDNIYGKSEIQIDKLKLSKNPILSSSQITSYFWNEHKIAYSESIYDQLLEHTDLWRKGFLVTVGKERIYWGLFQTYLDSYACLNPVIFLMPRFPGDNHVLTKSIVIERSYFGSEGLENKPEPRNDSRIYYSLKYAGILVE